jgi:hypothetical protein
MAEKLPFDWRTAQQLMSIAKSGCLMRQTKDLPASWGTLYELAQLPGDIFGSISDR